MMSVFLLVTFLAWAPLAQAGDISIVTEDFPPYNYVENGEIKGISTEVVQAVLKETGTNAKIEVYPWARAYKMATEKANVLIYSIGRIKQREDLFKWAGIVAPSDICFFKLKERSDITVRSLDDIKKYEVGILRQDMCLEYLENKGFKIKTVTDTDEQSIRMLVKKRVDLIPFDKLGFVYKVRELGYNLSDFEAVYVLDDLSKGLYMAFSRGTSDHIVEKFKHALDKIKADGTYEHIVNKYSGF
jgi:polar amino acid transport system substrate-binding protein